MLFKRFYDVALAQASYLIGCQATGEALIVDPNRDVDQYLAAAEHERMRITHVTETHIHADFVSGSRELAHRAGARLLLSDEGGADWSYAFAGEAGAVLLHDRDTFSVGNVRIDVRHTPGHTPEHLTFLVTDTRVTDQPMGALTGDFIFVGDVGRPDLLERAAKVEGTKEAAARQLHRSIRDFLSLPDHLQIWPGHGAGSACGKSLGAVPQSTLGYEKIANWALAVTDEDEFVRMVLEGQPEPPTYFAEMKRINKMGPRILGGFARPPRLAPSMLPPLLDAGALVIDTRHAADFAEAHIPGTLNIPLGASFTTWAGWLVPYDRDIYLIADDSCTSCPDEAVKALALIGLDRVAGYVGSEAIAAWTADGRALGTIPRITVAELASRLAAGSVAALDVRWDAEWGAGHVPGARHLSLGELPHRLEEVDRRLPLAIHCQSGTRSAIAASLLRARGFENVLDVAGGFAAWEAAGYPVVRGNGR